MIDQTFGNVWIIEKEVGRAPHPASLADLVEVLKQEGAVEHQFCGSKSNLRKGKPLDLTCIYTAGHFPTCGRYLVLPLGDTP